MFVQIAFFLSVLCCAFSTAIDNAPVHMQGTESWETSDLLKDASIEYLTELRGLRQNVRSKGCRINMCFALQGDDFMTLPQFEAQKSFIELIVAITATDKRGNFCAVQYSRTTKAISPLTKRTVRFLNKVQRARKSGRDSTNIASALAYAEFQLRPRTNQPRKIILFGDGLDTVGAEPTIVADRIRQSGTDICAIAVGDFASYTALEEITRDPRRVLKIHNYFELGELVFSVVNDVCGYEDDF